LEAAALRQLQMHKPNLPEDRASGIGKFLGNAIAVLVYLSVFALAIVAVLR
jgi:hypothetical protein